VNSLRGIVGRAFTYDDEDHLLTVGDASYQYDADGYLTTRAVGVDETTYKYSTRGELLSVTLPDGTAIEYVHDPLGRRIAKKVGGVVTEKYLWKGLTQLLAVYDGGDNLVMRFLYADSRMPVAMEKGAALYYLSYDQVGSLRAVADSSGYVVKRIDYDSFGNIITETNASFEIPFGFAGGLLDRDTALVRLGFRDYDPDIGRWTAKDPIGFWGGQLDLYGYCLNDPVNLFDPFGLILEADPYAGALQFYGAGAGLIVTGAMVTRTGVAIMAAGGPVGWIGGSIVTAVGVAMWSTGVWTVYQGTQIGPLVDPADKVQTSLSSDSFWGAGTACLDY
jgi:RHS repeat-associated protein